MQKATVQEELCSSRSSSRFTGENKYDRMLSRFALFF